MGRKKKKAVKNPSSLQADDAPLDKSEGGVTAPSSLETVKDAVASPLPGSPNSTEPAAVPSARLIPTPNREVSTAGDGETLGAGSERGPVGIMGTPATSEGVGEPLESPGLSDFADTEYDEAIKRIRAKLNKRNTKDGPFEGDNRFRNDVQKVIEDPTLVAIEVMSRLESESQRFVFSHILENGYTLDGVSNCRFAAAGGTLDRTPDAASSWAGAFRADKVNPTAGPGLKAPLLVPMKDLIRWTMLGGDQTTSPPTGNPGAPSRAVASAERLRSTKERRRKEIAAASQIRETQLARFLARRGVSKKLLT